MTGQGPADRMFKAVVLLTRKENATREDFRSWWLGEHAALARQLPGLRQLTFNVVESSESDLDGISELWFDSREAFDAAYATELGQRVAADSTAHVSRRNRLIIDEHSIVEP